MFWHSARVPRVVSLSRGLKTACLQVAAPRAIVTETHHLLATMTGDADSTVLVGKHQLEIRSSRVVTGNASHTAVEEKQPLVERSSRYEPFVCRRVGHVDRMVAIRLADRMMGRGLAVAFVAVETVPGHVVEPSRIVPEAGLDLAPTNSEHLVNSAVSLRRHRAGHRPGAGADDERGERQPGQARPWERDHDA